MIVPGLVELREGLANADSRDAAIDVVSIFLLGLGLSIDDVTPMLVQRKNPGRPPRQPDHDFRIAVEASRIIKCSPDTQIGRAIGIAASIVACHHGFPVGMRVPKTVDLEKEGVDVLRGDLDLDAVVSRISNVMIARNEDIAKALSGGVFIEGSRRSKRGRGRPGTRI